ncbi:MAG: DUF2321 domain-containing protein [Phycisphaerae bacterium]|nr:DUF2321 domain-containing protein [Phycisphaerae bacterium]
MSDNYDVQQVCENGHQITGCYNAKPEDRQKFCQNCGAPTITRCPDCDADIRGAKYEYIQNWIDARRGSSRFQQLTYPNVPLYCLSCGNPYPWTKNKIITAIQMLTENEQLDEQEKKTIEQDINNIAKDVPQSELSAMRIKRIWEKYGPIAYEAIMEFASRTAAKVLKG